MYKKKIIWIILIFLLILLFFIDLIVGSVEIPLKEIIKLFFTKTSDFPFFEIIFFDIRLPKTITTILVGSSLSVSGLQMQTIFRNPLAGPYILGISSGASLGVAIFVLGSSFFVGNFLFQIIGNLTIIIASLIGSTFVLLLILFVSMRVKNVMTVLIMGIMFGSAASSIISILQYFSSEAMLKSFVIWTMGSLMITKSQLIILTPIILFALLISLFSSKILNLIMLGENYAKTMGLNVRNSRIIIFFSTVLMAGSVTAFCGPIAFIGIAVPHISRFIFKTANHNTLTIASILIGSIMMLLSDIISQIPENTNLPINTVTALFGIPVVIFIVIKRRF